MHSRLLVASIIFVSAAISGSQGFGETILVSQSSLGVVSNAQSRATAISRNGRFVAFSSLGDNLVPGDTNGTFDVFVRDMLLGETKRVSVSSVGAQGNDASGLENSWPHWKTLSISSDGDIVAFESSASNLVAGDTNGKKDIFIHNLKSGVTQRVSVSTQGIECNVECIRPSLSSDGASIAFASEANNLVPGDTNNAKDVFVRDINAAITTRVSVSSAGTQSNAYSDFPDMSGDGRFIAFQSYANNLVVDDTNGRDDVFVKDRLSGQTERWSVSATGMQTNHGSYEPCISSDGNIVCFTTSASNIIVPDANGSDMDVIVRNGATGSLYRVSVSSYGVQGDNSSFACSIDASGRYVAFISYATNLVPNHLSIIDDVYRHDRLTGVTQQASVSSEGVPSNSGASATSISADGRVVAFLSYANNLSQQVQFYETHAYANDRGRLLDLIGLTIVRGLVTAGGFPSIATSDDDRLTIRPGPVFSTIQQPIQLIVDAVSPTTVVSELSMGIEFSCSSANIVQATEMYNFATAMYEPVDARSATTTDNLAVINITTNANRFIGPNGELRARIGYKAVGPVFSYPWLARLDVVYWNFEP